jgi:DNA repair protein RecO (recombination protein O)
MALCVRRWDWSETSQTALLFCRHSGLVRVVAKGSKRQDRRFSGGIEALTIGQAVLIFKPGSAMATLTGWDLREFFPALRRSLLAFHAGMFIADTIQLALTEHDPHPALFDAALPVLRGLGSAEPSDLRLVLRFQWLLLSETGYTPELARDVVTEGPLNHAPAYGFAPRRGGLTTDPGPPSEGSPQPGGVWRVRAETVGLLRALADDDPGPGTPPHASPDALRRANRLLAAYLQEILGRAIPSMAPFLGAAES